MMTPLFALSTAGENASYWPFGILAIGMIFVIVMIAVLRVHAFISLMLAAILVGFLSSSLPGPEGVSHSIQAINLSMEEFGNTAGKIAWVIALASIIGMSLMESGAADKIVRVMIQFLGEQRAGFALMICGFIIGIPVFFDTVFFLLIPLAQALSYRLGKKYVYFVMAIMIGAVITHSLVPPTPGPLIMADSLQINLGLAIIGGIVVAILPAIAVLFVGQIVDRHLNLKVKEGAGVSLADLKSIVSKTDQELPPFLLSILPIALPVALIALDASIGALGAQEALGGIYPWIEILGNKYLAMTIGALLSMYLLVRQKTMSMASLGETMAPPLTTAGVIILITAAGGAFGTMIKHAGVGEAIQMATEGSGISFILLGWLIAVIMKIAQGSGTVSMITTSGMMAAIVGNGAGLSYDPIYIYLAIGFGSLLISWMNDSGFWVVCKMSGFTEKETLKTWTLALAIMSILGLFEVLIISALIPFPFGQP